MAKVARYLRRCRFTSARDLNEVDVETIRCTLELWDCIVRDTLSSRHPTYRRLHSWLICQRVIDVDKLASEVDTLSEMFSDILEKRNRDGLLDTLHNATGFIKIFEPLLVEATRRLDATRVKQSRQCIEFIRRLNVGSGTSDAVESWLKARSAMRPQWRDPDLSAILATLPAPDLSYFVPYHSDGATYETLRTDPRWRKDEFLRWDSTMESVFGPLRGVNPGVVPRTSKLKEVPKTLKKGRIISKEPVSLQFAQHGVAEMLYHAIRTSWFGRHIDVRRADLNAHLAYLGSFDGRWTTIDCSSASDSVSHSLVMNNFSKEWIPILEQVRSRWVELPNGKRIRQRSFAPMGSAICFPIECVMFAALVEQAVRQVSGHSNFRVFGDDIVVESEFADDTIDNLERHGFVVNHEKTFSWPYLAGSFRESCGGEYFDGVNVTPIKISRSFRVSPKPCDRITNLQNWISLEGKLLQFPTARDYVLQKIYRESPKYYHRWLRSTEDSRYMRVSNFPGPMNDQIYNSDYQRVQDVGLWFTQETHPASEYEAALEYDYYQWLRKSSLREVDPPESCDPGYETGRTRVRSTSID